MTQPFTPAPFSQDRPVDEPLALEFGLSRDEWQRARQHLGRLPSFAELGVISVMWSEHCSYKSSRTHLKRLPSGGPQVAVGPGENAGAVHIGDGYCAVFKMESHNHPSYIEPYQGAATGVGGILRDVFTMGARPVASLNSLRFGDPNHPKTRTLLHGVVSGIGGYGNRMGVPTVGGEIIFHRRYDQNILVNAFSLGIAKTDELFFGTASGVGNLVLYVGAKTGRDGIHGATMASAEFDDKSEAKLPTVQVGDPFTEKLLLEACLDIFRADVLEGVQDMGAAGLTSSSVEMAARAGNGIELNLDLIPRRTEALTPYEMLLSESQERMLMVAKPGQEQRVFDICQRWELDVATIGRVTDTGRFVCTCSDDFDPHTGRGTPNPRVVVDLPVDLLTEAAPRYDRPQQAPPAHPAPRVPNDSHEHSLERGLDRWLLDMLSRPNVGSRASVWQQYDHIVGNGTVVRPGQAGAAVVRVYCGRDDRERATARGSGIKEKYLAMAVDGNGRHVELDARNGAAMAVAEATRNVACTGATPLALTDCLNFASPERPEIMGQFAAAIDGIADAATHLNTPVISGNVSLYNETQGQGILPTPTIGAVGQLQHLDHLLTSAFQAPGHAILWLGNQGTGNLCGSEYQDWTHGQIGGAGPRIDLPLEARLQRLVVDLATRSLLMSAHDASDGGLAVAIAEATLERSLGARIEWPAPWSAAHLFSEEPSRVIVSTTPANKAAVDELARASQVPCAHLGQTQADGILRFANGAQSFEVPVLSLRNAHDRCLDAIIDPVTSSG